MRRASLLALALAPAISAAQIAPPPSVGQITFPTVALSSTDGFINAGECAAGTITLRWSTGLANPSQFQVFAHNVTTDQNESSTGPCPKADNTSTGLHAAAVVTIDDPNDLTEPTKDIEVPTNLIAAAAGKSCTSTATEDIVLCVEATSGATVATARGKLVLDARAPAAPPNVKVSPGEGALNVSWDDPKGSPQAESYLVDAEQIGTTSAAFDPVGIHTSQRVTATSLRLSGLVDDVVYRVRVFAFSTADNPSVFDPAFAATGTPQPVNDFYETYRADGGREQGGCGIGGAGPVGLLAIAALLVLRRRS